MSVYASYVLVSLMRNRGFSLHLVLIVDRVGAPSETGSRLSTHTHTHTGHNVIGMRSGRDRLAPVASGLSLLPETGWWEECRLPDLRSHGSPADYWRRLWAVPIGQATHYGHWTLNMQITV